MSNVFENESRQWFYQPKDGSRPVGPYVTQEKAQAAFDAATPKSATKPISFYDVQAEQFRDATQADWDLLWHRTQRFNPNQHYAFRKRHTRVFFVALLTLAAAGGWELNNLHHPVTLSFCADGGSTTGNPTLR